MKPGQMHEEYNSTIGYVLGVGLSEQGVFIARFYKAIPQGEGWKRKGHIKMHSFKCYEDAKFWVELSAREHAAGIRRK